MVLSLSSLLLFYHTVGIGTLHVAEFGAEHTSEFGAEHTPCLLYFFSSQINSSAVMLVVYIVVGLGGGEG